MRMLRRVICDFIFFMTRLICEHENDVLSFLINISRDFAQVYKQPIRTNRVQALA